MENFLVEVQDAQLGSELCAGREPGRCMDSGVQGAGIWGRGFGGGGRGDFSVNQVVSFWNGFVSLQHKAKRVWLCVSNYFKEFAMHSGKGSRSGNRNRTDFGSEGGTRWRRCVRIKQ